MNLKERISHSQVQCKVTPTAESVAKTLSPRYAIVACLEDGINPAVSSALRFQPGEALFINVGGGGNPDHLVELERSLAAAIFLFGVQEVIFVGHQTCKWSQLEMSAVTDAFRKQGITRQAFGDADLRRWFGAFHSSGKNVQALVERISKSPMLPASVQVHGVLLDEATGKASILIEGTARATSSVAARSGETATGAGKRQASPSPRDVDAIAGAIPAEKLGDILKGQSQYAAVPPLPKSNTAKDRSAAPKADENVAALAKLSLEVIPDALTDFNSAFLYLRQVLARLRSENNLKGRVADLKYRLSLERDPIKFLQALEAFAGQIESERTKLFQAVQIIRSTLAKDLTVKELQLLVKTLFQ